MHTYILDHHEKDCLGVICSGIHDRDVSTLSQQSHADKTCYIYRLHHKPEVLVVQCKVDVLAEQAFSWTEQVNREITEYSWISWSNYSSVL